MAMFGRIECCIEYNELLSEEKQVIVNYWYDEMINKLNPIEESIIDNTNIKNWFEQNVERYDNIRLLITKMENAIFDKLTEKLIFCEMLDDEGDMRPKSINSNDFM